MKKTLIVLLILFFIIILMFFMLKMNIESSERNIKSFNMEYEQYLEQEIYGTDIATLINKAIDNNKKYEIQKDEDGLYIDDNKYYIGIKLKFLEGSKIYDMETIEKVGITEFIQNFNLMKFKCTEIKYHTDTNRVKEMIFEEIEE